LAAACGEEKAPGLGKQSEGTSTENQKGKCMNTPTVPTPSFDIENVRQVLAARGFTLDYLPDKDEDEEGAYEATISATEDEALVSIEWASARNEWGVYVDDGHGSMSISDSHKFATNISTAASIAARLNETDADRARRLEDAEKYLIPCTEIHCEFFGIGHEERVSQAYDEFVIHTRPTNSDTNWGVVVNKPSGQTEWGVEINSNPYEMPVSEIDELIAQLLLARADLVSINAV
jgi:hypothetical protein